MGVVRAVRRVARHWLRRPWHTVTIIVTLSVGLGMNATVLSFARAVLVGAIPFQDPHRIVRISESNRSQDVEDMVSSIPTLRDWQSMARSFEELGASSAPLNVVLEADDRFQRLRATLVTPSLFRVTGVDAVAGRLLDERDNLRPGAHPVAMLSEEFWRSRYDGALSAIDSNLTLNGVVYTIVGVLPERYPNISDPAGTVDVWVPMMMASHLMGREVHQERVLRAFSVLARLRPGVTFDRAQEDLRAVGRRLAEAHPRSQDGWVAHVIPVREDLLGDLRAPAIALVVGAGLLLLIACANAGFLLLLLTAERKSEFALRLALGASPGDLLRRLAEENVAVVLGSAALALLLAVQVPPLFAGNLPPAVPRFVDLSLGRTAVLVTVAVSAMILGLLCGLPLLQGRRRDLVRSLVGGARGSRARAVSRLERGLILSQVATAAVLAFGAILLLRSLTTLRSEDVGFRPEGLLTARIDVPPDARAAGDLPSTARELLLAAHGTAGVSEAYLWSPHVPGEAVWFSRFHVEGRALEDHELPGGRIHGVSPGAVTGVGIPLVDGRDIERTDLVAGRRVALVSETVARALWPGQTAVGKRIRKWNWDQWVTVVGVARDVRHAGRQGVGSEYRRDFYFAMDQAPELGRDLVLLARTGTGADAALNPLRSAIAAAAPDLPVYDVRTMTSRLRDHETLARVTAFLSVGYAVVALILAALGLHTILSYAVERRRPEIGLRMALGAPSERIAREVTRDGLRTGLLGVGLGLAGALVGARALSSLLYQIRPTDLPTLVVAVTLLLAVALAASALPAIRTMRWSPASLLRGE